jgi:hypothetical protein
MNNTTSNRKEKLISDIVSNITNKQLWHMLYNAVREIKDWQVQSITNPMLSKGDMFNILTKEFSVDKRLSKIYKFRLIREFYEYLPKEFLHKMVELQEI